MTPKNEQDKPCVNPIEDQRKEALRHYDEAARIANHWSSFVRDAILAYNPIPEQVKPTEQPKSAEEMFPYHDNHTDDLGIREWNQRMYDKREAYKLGESSAQQRIKELEENLAFEIRVANGQTEINKELAVDLEEARQRIKELEEQLEAKRSSDDDYEEDDDFEPCSECDGHDACADFGCAIKAGLGHMLQKPL